MSRMPFGCAQADSRHQRDIAERSAAEVRHHGAPGGGRARSPRAPDGASSSSEMGPNSSRLSAGSRWSSSIRLLADDGVEEIAAVGHAGARRSGDVAQRVHQGVAVLVDGHVEPAGHQHLRAVVHAERLPVFGGESEARHAPDDALGVDAQRELEVFVDFAEHLPRVDHLHGRLFAARNSRAAPPRSSRGYRDTNVPPKSTGMRSGCRWSRAQSTRSLLLVFVIYFGPPG